MARSFCDGIGESGWKENSTPLKINGWNLKIIQLKGKIIFQTSILGFHVNFWGCKGSYSTHLNCLFIGLKLSYRMKKRSTLPAGGGSILTTSFWDVHCEDTVICIFSTNIYVPYIYIYIIIYIYVCFTICWHAWQESYTKKVLRQILGLVAPWQPIPSHKLTPSHLSCLHLFCFPFALHDQWVWKFEREHLHDRRTDSLRQPAVRSNGY